MLPASRPVRRLIVNADDFGQTTGINEGVIRSYQEGVLTSASLMVRWPEAARAAQYARTEPGLSLGLHIDLGEWIYHNGEWVRLYAVTATDDETAIRAEILDQLETFRRLMDVDPSHLDSHQHVHRTAPADRIVAGLGESLGIPVRHGSEAIRYVGSFYGQGTKGNRLDGILTAEHLIAMITELPPGTTELACHPGLGLDAHGMYVEERGEEVAVLCDPLVRAAIHAQTIQLISFHDCKSTIEAAGPFDPTGGSPASH